MLYELITQKIGVAGRMISASKSGYRESFPDNLAIFNANICTKNEGKIWYGDIDLTKAKEDLSNIATETQEDLYVLYEMDARFESATAPKLEKAAVVFSADGSVKLNDNLKSRYSL